MQDREYEKRIKDHIDHLMLMPEDGFSPVKEAEWLRALIAPPDYKTDPLREKAFAAHTGIFVRAIGQDGRWGSYDISELNKESLMSWLRSRGGENQWAENVVALVLGHPT